MFIIINDTNRTDTRIISSESIHDIRSAIVECLRHIFTARQIEVNYEQQDDPNTYVFVADIYPENFITRQNIQFRLGQGFQDFSRIFHMNYNGPSIHMEPLQIQVFVNNRMENRVTSAMDGFSSNVRKRSGSKRRKRSKRSSCRTKQVRYRKRKSR